MTSASAAAATAEAEPGSFRDPDSRVFYRADGVYRALSERGLADWRALADSGVAERLIADGRLVASEEVDASSAPADLIATGCAGVLRHERIPFVSYPYEWTFGMLRDAALLQLDLLLAALEHDLILKDATPYNVQWRGARPVFVDVGSFEPLRKGEAWVGYRQFCMLFLNPLLIQSLRGIPFQPWLRGAIDGIEPGECRAMLSRGDMFRRGVISHVYLHSRLEKRYGDRSKEVKRNLREAGFKKEMIVANVRGLRKLIGRRSWTPPSGVWTEYGEHNSYSDADAERKDEFVREVVRSREWLLAWDIGANNGRYSRIAAEGARSVVAFDSDPDTIENLYRRLHDAGEERILPLVMNVADPSPGLGWRGLERRPLPDRGKPDLVLALALLHHVAITANVPVREFVDWLASLGCTLVIEFMTREDPMVQRLLAAKREGLHPDYDREFFERCLGEAFDVQRSETLASGTRILYHAKPR